MERNKNALLKEAISEVLHQIDLHMKDLEKLEQTRGPDYGWLSSKRTRLPRDKRLSRAQETELEALLLKLNTGDWSVSLERLELTLKDSRTQGLPPEDVPAMYKGILAQIIDEQLISAAIREATKGRSKKEDRRSSVDQGGGRSVGSRRRLSYPWAAVKWTAESPESVIQTVSHRVRPDTVPAPTENFEARLKLKAKDEEAAEIVFSGPAVIGN
ncbi:uncharacterized protein LOC124160693 [Ischnura elegans]|uniref:uncharacterized protein LOC124160693 n=1 Tax=Ischnura elegans TaxID=197161 RepID=UPI001ED8B240|nr:uncharacterized protein LOC124160693 [Ischnura elegans]